MENERYQSVDMDEIYYITDTQKLNKTYEDFLENTCLKTAWMGQKLWKL